MDIQHVIVTADAQAVAGECYFVGAELAHTTDTSLIIYDENAATKTAAQKFVSLKVTDEMQHDHVMFPIPGKKCSGIYCDWTAGTATVYYYKK